MTAKVLAGIACSMVLVACGGGGGGGGGPGDSCANIDGFVYGGAEILNGCGLSNYEYDSSAMFTFHQASTGSCDFTVTAQHGECTGSFTGTDTVKWLCPAYGSVTYNEATATFSGDFSTLSGSFTWGGWTGHCAAGETATTTFNSPPLQKQ